MKLYLVDQIMPLSGLINVPGNKASCIQTPKRYVLFDHDHSLVSFFLFFIYNFPRVCQNVLKRVFLLLYFVDFFL